MIKTEATFAHYSKTLCWIVAAITTLLAVLSFTGDEAGAAINGALWLGVAAVFAVSGFYLSRKGGAEASSGTAAGDPGSSEQSH